MGEFYQLLEAGEGRTQTQWVMMKFGMIFTDPKRNAVPIEELAQRQVYFVTPY